MARQAALGGLLVMALALAGPAAVAARGLREASVPANRRMAALLPRAYLSNAQLGDWMDEFVGRCGSIGRKFTVGRSASGQPFYGLEVADRPGAEEAEPYFKYVGNMHGNEASGRMVLPMLAEWLCANNGKDERATRIVRDMHLVIVPTMNPDGFDRRQRENANGYDLNRNFPDPIVDRGSDLRRPGPDAQPEVKAVMDLILSRPWTASANLHEGSVVVNYPYDGYTAPGQQGTAHLTPDDATFKYLARAYASRNPAMARSAEFPGGITNGAQWYDIYGGMQDFNYVVAGDMEMTLEISPQKFVPAPGLLPIWQQNRDALIALPIAAALGGAHGRVTDADTGAPLAATLVVKTTNARGDPVPFYASKQFGFYSRPLAPGATYTVVASMPGYKSAEATISTPADGSVVIQDFKLKPQK